MASNVSIVQKSGNFSQQNQGPHINDGSTVKGRVISQNSEGNYTVSLAGQKINVQTPLKMVPGQVFTAKVSVQNGLVKLILEGKTGNSAAVSKLVSTSDGNKLNSEAIRFLQSLGLEADSTAFRLIQFFQQMGLKIYIPQAKKALNVSKKLNEDQEEGAETALLLEQKGIKADEKTVKKVMYSGERKNIDRNENNSGQNSSEEKNESQILDENCSFIKNYFKSVDEAALDRELSPLAFMNSLKNHNSDDNSSKAHWFLFPFEWPGANAYGDIRFFMTEDYKSLKKLVLKCHKNVRKFMFDVYFIKNEPDYVRFSIESVDSLAQRAKYSSLLQSMIKNSGWGKSLKGVEFVELDELSGFCSDSEVISQVRGFA